MLIDWEIKIKLLLNIKFEGNSVKRKFNHEMRNNIKVNSQEHFP